MRSAAWLSTLFGVVSFACEQPEPARELRLDVPALVTSKQPVLVHARAIQQDGTARELTGSLDYRVTPADLATLGKGGVLTCARSGDGTVTLRASAVEGRASFSCKLAARLEAPAKFTLDASQGEVALPIEVLDAAGKPIDLPLSITSDAGSVVQVRAGRLVAGHVGHARLSARAGDLVKQIEVDVVRSLKPEVLPVDQNRRISYSLEAGKYQLSIQLPSPRRLKIDWLGAPYCAYQGEGTSHVSDCTLQGRGSVSFDNPAFLLRAEKTPSVEGVTLREIP